MGIQRSAHGGTTTAEMQPDSSRVFQQQCLEAAERFAERYLSIMDLLGEELYQLADHADEHELRRLYFSAMQNLYSRRSELKGEFKKEFLASIKAELQLHHDSHSTRLFANAAINGINRLRETPPDNATGSVAAECDASQDEDQHTRMARTLPKGSWIEFRQSDGNKYRARFTWVNQSSGVYLFVDRDGRKAPDRAPEELANAFRIGAATIIQSTAQLARAANDQGSE